MFYKTLITEEKQSGKNKVVNRRKAHISYIQAFISTVERWKKTKLKNPKKKKKKKKAKKNGKTKADYKRLKTRFKEQNIT